MVKNESATTAKTVFFQKQSIDGICYDVSHADALSLHFNHRQDNCTSVSLDKIVVAVLYKSRK